MLFDNEGKFSVVAEGQIKEEQYAYGQTVNVLWDKREDGSILYSKTYFVWYAFS